MNSITCILEYISKIPKYYRIVDPRNTNTKGCRNKNTAHNQLLSTT